MRRDGKSYAHPLIVLVALPNQLEVTRFGVAAGKSIGNAVRRNRAKRLMREAVRSQLELVAPGWDIMLIARRPMARSGVQDVRDALASLLLRAGIRQESVASG